MKSIPLHQLIGRTNFKANVRLEGNNYEPLIRTVLKVVRKKVGGYQWIYWYWTPEPRKDGIMDCGYAGIREDHWQYNDNLVVYE